MVAASAYGPVVAAAGIAVRAVTASGTASIARAAAAARRRRHGAGPVPCVSGAVPPRPGNPVVVACFPGGGVADAGAWLLVISGVLRDGCGGSCPATRGRPGPAAAQADKATMPAPAAWIHGQNSDKHPDKTGRRTRPGRLAAPVTGPPPPRAAASAG